MAWSSCKYCDEKIVWAQMSAGQWLPMDPEVGGKHDCGESTPRPAKRTVWRYRDDDFCRPTSCPQCGAEVFFVRHNGGSIWFDELGFPWPKHACFDDDDSSRRVRVELVSHSLSNQPLVFGVVVETVAPRGGKGGLIIVRCSDGTTVNQQVDTARYFLFLVGQVVRVVRRDGKVAVFRLGVPARPRILPIPPPRRA
jgi:hypothetical protein